MSSRIVSWPSGLSTSPLRLKATAHSPARPSASIASRTSRRPRRATSIQWTGWVLSHTRGPSTRSALGRPQVFVEMTSQPIAA